MLRGVTVALQRAADDQSEAVRTDLIQPVRFLSIAAIRRSGPAGIGDHLAGQLLQRLRIHRVLAGPRRADGFVRGDRRASSSSVSSRWQVDGYRLYGVLRTVVGGS